MPRLAKELIDSVVYAMAERGWSDWSIAAAHHIDIRTLRARFSPSELEECRLSGKQKAMDLLWEAAAQKKDVQAIKYLVDRLWGPVTQKIQISKDEAIRVLENELISKGISDTEIIEETQKLLSPPN